jgi:hypothetical protein
MQQNLLRAKSANEQQDTPSDKACSLKIESVSCRLIQAQRRNGIFTISSFLVVHKRYSTVSAKPRLSN